MDQIGGPDVLQHCDVPEPVAGVGQLIVAVHAASANPGVVKVRKGQRRAFLNSGFPHTMGRDFSGAVRAAGAGVTEFKAGDAVFGVLPLNVEGTAAGTIALMKLSESVAAHRLLESGTRRGKIFLLFARSPPMC